MLADIEKNMVTKSYLTMKIGQERYGVDLAHIQEILPLERLQVMPLVPTMIRGVINVRGSIIPIIDASVRLGGDVIVESGKTNVLIINFTDQAPGAVLGLMVNTIEKVIMIDVATIEQTLPFGAKIRKDFIEGLVHINNELVILLSIDHLLSLAELETIVSTGYHHG